jgi:hypothetical protein
MPYAVTLFTPLVSSSNPVGAKNLIVSSSVGNFATVPAVGALDDASNITIFMTSSASSLTSSGTNVPKVSMIDFSQGPNPPVGVTVSTAFFTYSQFTTATVSMTSGTAYTISNIAFRSITVSIGLSSGNTDGEIVAWIAKQITV